MSTAVFNTIAGVERMCRMCNQDVCRPLLVVTFGVSQAVKWWWQSHMLASSSATACQLASCTQWRLTCGCVKSSTQVGLWQHRQLNLRLALYMGWGHLSHVTRFALCCRRVQLKACSAAWLSRLCGTMLIAADRIHIKCFSPVGSWYLGSSL